jgi:hypothetical protein
VSLFRMRSGSRERNVKRSKMHIIMDTDRSVFVPTIQSIITTALKSEGTCAMEVMPSRVPRRRLLTGSPRVFVPGIAASRAGCTSKKCILPSCY